MRTVHGVLAAGVVAIALSGCAASPESIKPANISTAQYAYLNCAQLADYKVTLNNAYKKAADSEDTARLLDDATYLTIGFPVGSMTHQSVPWQVADLKGRIIAVDKLQVQGNCAQQRQAAK